MPFTSCTWPGVPLRQDRPAIPCQPQHGADDHPPAGQPARRRCGKTRSRSTPELLRRLYQRMRRLDQRVHEKLVEEEGVQVSYPTLTRLAAGVGAGQAARKARCDRVPDEPGVEMQHDTTVYKVQLAGRPTRVIASLLVPALLEAAVLEVLPRVQPLRHEVLPARGA